MNMKRFLSVALSALVALSLTACGGSEGSSSNGTPPAADDLRGKVTLSGSTSMEELSKVLAERFEELHPDVTPDVQLGGSSVGVSNAGSGVSDIGNVSRPLKDSETGLVAHTVAIDGISVIVSPENTVTDLTLEQIAAIYRREITNWSEVGGEDLSIVVVGREAGSGTRGAFEEIVKIENQAQYAQELTETGAVKTSVASTKGAIGYVSMSHVDGSVRALKVDGVDATEENAKNGSYKLSRPFIMAVKEGTLRPEVQAFLDFVLSDEGQELVRACKLITVQ